VIWLDEKLTSSGEKGSLGVSAAMKDTIGLYPDHPTWFLTLNFNS
jgi:hypothetical protein